MCDENAEVKGANNKTKIIQKKKFCAPAHSTYNLTAGFFIYCFRVII